MSWPSVSFLGPDVRMLKGGSSVSGEMAAVCWDFTLQIRIVKLVFKIQLIKSQLLVLELSSGNRDGFSLFVFEIGSVEQTDLGFRLELNNFTCSVVSVLTRLGKVALLKFGNDLDVLGNFLDGFLASMLLLFEHPAVDVHLLADHHRHLCLHFHRMLGLK